MFLWELLKDREKKIQPLVLWLFKHYKKEMQEVWQEG